MVSIDLDSREAKFNLIIMKSIINLMKVFAVSAVLLVSGCATTIQHGGSRIVGSENVKLKNYIIGDSKSVAVGDSIIKFQDYWVTTTEKSVATLDKPVNLRGGPVDINLMPGREYPIVGDFIDQNINYFLVRSDGGLLVMVRSDGAIRDRVGNQTSANKIVTVVWPIEISDPSARVSKEVASSINSKEGYQNFELIYTGLSAESINLTYREFSPEGLARVAFFQNLTYPATAKIISFKRYKLEVHSATAEKINFTVLEDGR